MNATAENLLAQLLRLGLDAGSLCAQAAQVEIDRFDHWATGSAATGTSLVTGGSWFVPDAV